jgi:hypothetical protein
VEATNSKSSMVARLSVENTRLRNLVSNVQKELADARAGLKQQLSLVETLSRGWQAELSRGDRLAEENIQYRLAAVGQPQPADCDDA